MTEKTKEIQRPQWQSTAEFMAERALEFPAHCIFDAIVYVGDQIGRLADAAGKIADAADGMGIKVWHENNPIQG